MKQQVIQPEFVEAIPRELEEGVLYISIPFATAVHNCCCGCGNRVVTPLTPFKWKLSYDGEVVWLSPSIGNWSFPCQSHYWIKRNRIQWDDQWSADEIAAGRKRDLRAQQQHFAPLPALLAPADTRPVIAVPEPPTGFWKGLWRKLKLSRSNA